MTAGELAAAAALSPGAVTTVLDRLERRGLVVRRRDEDDRRRVIAELTNEARRLAHEAYRPIASYAAAYLDELSDDDLGVILRFLENAIELNERRARELADAESAGA